MSFDLIQKVTGNNVCVDCDNKNPDWASINLGVLMCLECSGSHRHIGVHISQVRSLKLDTECWQGEMLDFMCSVGNAAFNRSWEKDCPPWIIHPEEYPYLPFVREHYINQKYTYRLFLRKELGDQVSTSFTDDVHRGLESGMVMKKSAENFISPWQQRYLKFHVKEGEPVLAYYKEAALVSAKGEITLKDSIAGLLDPSNADKDHPHQFEIKTSSESEHSGRVFLFSVGSNKEAMEWVQSIRRHSGQVSKRSGKNEATPIMSGMELERLNLKRGLAQKLEEEGVEVAFEGGILQREAYSFGRWMQRFAMIVDGVFYILMEQGGAVVSALPLKGGNVDKYPVNVDREDGIKAGQFGVLCALAHLSLDAGSEANKNAWLEALKGSIQTITIGR
ncbi:hypothetical protein TrST_g3638 [Triparma strigata]|uniref:Uncharacterized protein n=1 Tax=Triparma strigata TaxID=1606541 RepID=A0A9W7A9G2_9STRA|nr:hypothetical protein TrST_g3638 [Triparma strigata]